MPPKMLGASQALKIASRMNDVSDIVRNALLDPSMNLSDATANALRTKADYLVDASAKIATQAASMSFQDADQAFARVHGATDIAATRLSQLAATVARIDSFVKIVSGVVDVAAAFATLDPVKAIDASTSLASDVGNA